MFLEYSYKRRWTTTFGSSSKNEMVDVLVELDPDIYGPCVCYHNGRKFLYAKAIKAIYGAIKSALLFYQLFSGQLSN